MNIPNHSGGGFTLTSIPPASNITLDMGAAEQPLFDLGALTGDTNVTFINGRDGQDAKIRVRGNGHALNWDTGICGGTDDLPLPALSAAANRWDFFAVHVIASAAKPYKVIASNLGAGI